MELFKDVDELKELMDKLILQTLELVEEDVTLKVNIETLTNEGALQMAKTRYSQGVNTVSACQLPAESEDTREFNALKTVSRGQDELNTAEFLLDSHPIDKDTDHVDPIKWFGILVPQSLKTARDRYAKAVELTIESANIEQRIRKNYEVLGKLRTIKVDFEK